MIDGEVNLTLDIDGDQTITDIDGNALLVVPADYVGPEVPRKTSEDLTADGATVNVPAGYYQEPAGKTIELEEHGYFWTPDEQGVETTLTPSEGYAGFEKINVEILPVPSNYVGSSIPRHRSEDLYITDGNIVNVPHGYYENDAAKLVPWTYLGESPELVNDDFYHDTIKLEDTDYNGWTASTQAKVLKATATAGTFGASMGQYEYIIRWDCEATIAYNAGATKKVIPIRECTVYWQTLFRRPASAVNIESETFDSNAVATLFTAPLIIYYNSSGNKAYSDSASYGIYTAVQSPTFSNATSNLPTVTVKTPTWNARCSTTYFNTSRAADIDQENTLLKRKCRIYRVHKNSACREFFAEVIKLYNNPL